ncbi:MAG: amidohydrolase family protein [Planctomycetaceae bacterium]|nr:amidohydrolase family protein [Planctomycetaceae bacterium]
MQTPEPVLDIHLHLAALEPESTDGGWFSSARRSSIAFTWIRRLAGLPALGPNFDADFRDLIGKTVEVAGGLAAAAGKHGFAAVALPFALPCGDDGTPLTDQADFYVPTRYAARLAAESPLAIPGAAEATASKAILFGCSIHPYREDALDHLRRWRHRGAALVKWIPTTQNIDPADPRTVAFARACAELAMPLLIHTGSEGATRNRCPAWNNPAALIPLLASGAVIIAAHAGMRSLPHEPCHFQTWTAMLPDWPSLYGDTAALFGLRPRTLVRALDKHLVADRLVHGSDWPVPSWPGWYWPGLNAGTIRRLSAIRNPLWRDVATKLAAGIPEASFTRGWRLIAPDVASAY